MGKNQRDGWTDIILYMYLGTTEGEEPYTCTCIS